MIQLPTLMEQDLDFLKNKKVFIYALDGNLFRVYQAFRYLNIEVIGCSYFDETLQPSRKKILAYRILGLRYIKPDRLAAFFEKEDKASLFVQPVCWRKEDLEAIEQRVAGWDLQCTHLRSGALANSIALPVVLAELKSPLRYRYHCMRRLWKAAASKLPFRTASQEAYILAPHPNTVVICSPAKTADHTLNHTFDHLCKHQNQADGKQQDLRVINLWHDPTRIDRAGIEKSGAVVKIIVGVREPISQNLSLLYQDLDMELSLHRIFYQALFETVPAPSHKQLVSKYERLFENGMDVQNCWDIFVHLHLRSKSNKGSAPEWIQGFMPNFTQYVLDITAYPFDKEKGYAIIKDGNTEVFVYQLEKLNSLVPELSDWVGVRFDSLMNGNEASSKAIAESYKQAQKEIEITQEYFDSCFDESYVKHCYSEADIEKFKAKWRSHIKK